jgi:hypothetical protein
MAEEHNALKYGSPISVAAAAAAGGAYGDVGISRLSESLVAVMDLWGRPEWLRGERRWAVSPSQAGVAAEFAQVGVRNPAGSNILVVIEDFNLWDAGATTLIEARIAASTVVDATSTPQSRDTRLPFQTGLRTVSLANSAAAILGALNQKFEINPATYAYYPIGVVLSPGFDFFIGPEIVFTTIGATLRGYERVAFPGELGTRG